MKTLSFLLQKEFKQIFRNPTLLKMIVALPIIQLIILPLAADYEIKNINVAVVDHDHSSFSRELTDKIVSSGYFILVDYGNNSRKGMELIESDEADIVLEIPSNFERNLIRENKEELFLAINAINGTKANVGGAYLSRIITDFNRDIQLKRQCVQC